MKTYTKEQEARFVETLKEIQRSIPPQMIKAATEEQALSPTVEKVMLEAVGTESIDVEKRQKIQNLIDAGTFNKRAIKEVPKAVKAIDNFVNRAINKAIKDGRLPPRSHVKFLPSIKKLNEN